MSNELEALLSNSLPSFLMPGNVGDLTRVRWNYWQTVNFDFGTNPIYGPNTRQTQSFQVTQEAGLLLMAIGRDSQSYTNAGDLAPLQIDIKDRQSSRQFNDRPIPIQNIGKKFKPMILASPMLIMPNAFLDFTISSWVPADMQSTGLGKFSFVAYGLRMRLDDPQAVLSTITKGASHV